MRLPPRDLPSSDVEVPREPPAPYALLRVRFPHGRIPKECHGKFAQELHLGATHPNPYIDCSSGSTKFGASLYQQEWNWACLRLVCSHYGSRDPGRMPAFSALFWTGNQTRAMCSGPVPGLMAHTQLCRIPDPRQSLRENGYHQFPEAARHLFGAWPVHRYRDQRILVTSPSQAPSWIWKER